MFFVNFGDPLTFDLVPSTDQHFKLFNGLVYSTNSSALSNSFSEALVWLVAKSLQEDSFRVNKSF